MIPPQDVAEADPQAMKICFLGQNNWHPSGRGVMPSPGVQ